VVRRIEASLAAGRFRVTRDSVAGRQTVIGRRSAVLRHTFVLVAVFKADASPEHLDRFRAEADQYARTVKGGPGRAISAVAVAVVDAAVDTGGWGPGAVGAYPVLVDLATGRVTTPGGRGETSDRSLEQLVREHVVGAVPGSGRS